MNPQTVVPMSAPADAGSANERRPYTSPRPHPEHSAFVPVLLGTLSLLLGLGWLGYVQVTERDALKAAHGGQQVTVDSAGKLRGSLDALAADTQRLAAGGNASAALLVAELSKRGITINPQSSTAAALPAKP